MKVRMNESNVYGRYKKSKTPILVTMKNYWKAVKYFKNYFDDYCEKVGWDEEKKDEVELALNNYDKAAQMRFTSWRPNLNLPDELISIMTDGHTKEEVVEYGVVYDEAFYHYYYVDGSETAFDLVYLAFSDLINCE